MAPRRKVTLLDELFPVESTPNHSNKPIAEHDREKLRDNPQGFTREVHKHDIPSGIPVDSLKGKYCLVLPAINGGGYAKIFAEVEQLEFPGRQCPPGI